MPKQLASKVAKMGGTYYLKVPKERKDIAALHGQQVLIRVWTLEEWTKEHPWTDGVRVIES